MSVGTKMTALADEIRALSGTIDKLGLDTMKSNVNEANTKIGDQSELITQIITALEGKTAGSSGEDVTAETTEYTGLLTDLETAIDALPDAEGGSGGIEMCTVSTTYGIEGAVCYSDGENIIQDAETMYPSGASITVVKNSLLYLDPIVATFPLTVTSGEATVITTNLLAITGDCVIDHDIF